MDKEGHTILGKMLNLLAILAIINFIIKCYIPNNEFKWCHIEFIYFLKCCPIVNILNKYLHYLFYIGFC